MLFAPGGCVLLTTKHVETAWEKFKELLPVLSSCHFSYSSCFRNAMLHTSETWPLTRPDPQRLRRNNRAIIRQICNDKPEDVATVRSNKLLAQLEIGYLDVILREKGFAVIDSLKDSVVQSRHFATCRYKECVGQGSPR